MSDTRTKADEEMLEQTFDKYDQDADVQTENPIDGDGKSSDNQQATVKKKSKQNLYLVGGGVLATLILSVVMVSGTGTKPAVKQNLGQSAQQSEAAQPNTNAEEALRQSVAAAQVGGMTAPGEAAPAVGGFGEDNPAGAQGAFGQQEDVSAQLGGGQEGQSQVATFGADSASAVIAGVSQPVAQADVAPTVPVSAVATAQTLQEHKPATQQGIAMPSNAAEYAVVDKLQSLLSQQTEEIKTSIGQVGSKVTDLEKAVSEQSSINQKVDARLSKLEGGKSTVVYGNNGEVKAVAQKTKVKRAVVKKQVKAAETTTAKEVKKEAEDQVVGDVLVDKTVVASKATEGKKASEAAKASNLPKIDIYSIYAGRVWIKNQDGSLSTYSSGEKLPSGETIKSVDDDGSRVITDKRTLR